MTTASNQIELIERLLVGLGVDEPETRRAIAHSIAGEGEPAGAENVDALSARAERSERLAEASMAKIEMLACAIGACPACWGSDPKCRDCEGRGAPGGLLPDPQCFQTFVAPVLRRLADEQGGKHERLVPAPRRAPGRPAAPHLK